jgi:CheY-like chemotaxis protein
MKKILIVDDYEALLDLYQIWLEEKFEVIRASNGVEAVQMYREHRPDLVIMDIKLPVMSGDHAITKIMRIDPEANILAVTAYPYTETQLGVEVLKKNFNRQDFLDAIERRIRGPSITKPRP